MLFASYCTVAVVINTVDVVYYTVAVVNCTVVAVVIQMAARQYR